MADEDITKLPLEDRLTHKVKLWRALFLTYSETKTSPSFLVLKWRYFRRVGMESKAKWLRRPSETLQKDRRWK